jgi:outer membrane protein insertion porin family
VKALEDLYKERGYADVDISSEYTIDEEVNELDLTFTIEEGRQWKIGEIVFEGNELLGDSTLQKSISSKVQSLFNSGNYDAAKIAADTQSLQLTYQKNGFIDVHINDVRLEDIAQEDPAIRKLRVVFDIEEGQQWFFGGITVEGNTIYSDEQINE